MAKAKVTTQVLELTLTLDGNEAQFLADLLANVGGDPEYSRRRYADVITASLRDVGIRSTYPLSDTDSYDYVSFKNDIPAAIKKNQVT